MNLFIDVRFESLISLYTFSYRRTGRGRWMSFVIPSGLAQEMFAATSRSNVCRTHSLIERYVEGDQTL
jgi:hypothetical protein